MTNISEDLRSTEAFQLGLTLGKHVVRTDVRTYYGRELWLRAMDELSTCSASVRYHADPYLLHQYFLAFQHAWNTNYRNQHDCSVEIYRVRH